MARNARSVRARAHLVCGGSSYTREARVARRAGIDAIRPARRAPLHSPDFRQPDRTTCPL
ncbi:hypothetical protein CO709_08910 [Burkholderia thailandensis]|nr:hypothetical protein CO709_08910 [Burkholderia thailandensis]